MATQVPYTGEPTVSPSQDATPYAHADIPAAAFGGASAQARQGLGRSIEHVGDEIFSRAIALQQLDHQAAAANAAADFTTQMGEKYANYRSLQGKAAVDGYQPYIDDLNQTREKIGQGLSTYAQKLYLQESRSIQARSVFSAAAHAGDQHKSYLIGTSQAEINSGQRQAGLMPDSDGAFDSSIATNKSQGKFLGQLHGWSDAQIDDFINKSNSATVVERTRALADRDPVAAKKVLDKAIEQGLVASDDAGKVGQYIRSQKNNIWGRNESAKFMAGETGSLGKGIVPIEDAAHSVRMIEGGGNYNPPHPLVTHTIIDPNSGEKRKVTERALGAYGVMQSNLQPWLKEAGMPAMSEKEFIADEDAQDKLFQFKFGQYMQKYKSAEKAANVWFTGSPDPDPKSNDGHTTAPQYLQKFRAGLVSRLSGTKLADAAKAHADAIDPDDAEFRESFTNRVRIQHSHDRQMEREDEYERQSTLLDAVGPDGKGKLPVSVDELSPEAQDAYNNMSAKNQRKFDKVLMANARNGFAETPENTRQYQRLMGIANDPTRGDEATKELLDTDVNSLEMPYKWKQNIAKQRMAVFKNTQRNPALGHAMSLLAPMLDSAGISKRGSKDDFFVFQGALHLMMQDKMQDGKPLKDEDIKQMGASLLRQTSRPGSIFGNLWPTKEEAFRTTVPDDERKYIIEAYKRNTGVEPQDREIRSIYAAKQAREFNQYYTKKRNTELDAMTPTVPRSK